jgi:hypothetical protein
MIEDSQVYVHLVVKSLSVADIYQLRNVKNDIGWKRCNPMVNYESSVMGYVKLNVSGGLCVLCAVYKSSRLTVT